jgi:putative ABC transport system permease protein
MKLQRTPLSTLNLLAVPSRAAVWIAGVAFALLLIFIQLGFRGAVANTATVVYNKMRFDVLIRSPEYLHLYETRTFPRLWMDLVAVHPDVASVKPFYIMLNRWQSPSDLKYRGIAMMGMERDKPVLNVPEIDAELNLLGNPDWVLIDRASRKDFGPKDGKKFGPLDIGVQSELGGRKVTIAGSFKLGTGLATNGSVLLSDVGFARRGGIDPKVDVHLGLVQLQPGVNPSKAADDIRKYLNDRDSRSADVVDVFSRQAALDWEHHHWLSETPIGIIFQLGVILSLVVGAAIVYMVLSNDVANRIGEYATLKAMGYSQWSVALIILRQAWMLAGLGFIPAYLLAILMYWVTAQLAELPIFMTFSRTIGVLILAYVMCTVSGLLAIQKLSRAEPASLF